MGSYVMARSGFVQTQQRCPHTTRSISQVVMNRQPVSEFALRVGNPLVAAKRLNSCQVGWIVSLSGCI